jgi:CBS domain-containing protein
MKVRQIMQKELVTILPTTTIHDAALKMKEQKIGSIIVAEEGGILKGIVTDRDIALAVAADNKDPNKEFTSEIMTKDPVWINSDDDVDAALRLMNSRHVRRLPVYENNKLVGFLSTADVATEIKEELNQFIGLEETFAKHH